MHNKLIEHVNQLLEQLNLNCHDKLIVEKTLHELQNICQRILQENNYNSSFIFDLLLIIFKDYINLLNHDRFIRIKSDENIHFLRQFYQVMQIKYLETNLSDQIRREIFFSLFDQINQSKRLIRYLENDFNDSNCQMILYISIEIFKNLNILLISTDFEEKRLRLLRLFFQLIDQYFIRRENSRFNDLFIDNLVLFLVNLCRSNICLVPNLIQIHSPQLCLQWLTFDYLNVNEYLSIIEILFTISKHDHSIEILKNLDCYRILRQFQTKQINTKIEFITNKKTSQYVCQMFDIISTSLIDADELVRSNKKIIENIFVLGKSSFEQNDSQIALEDIFICLMKLCLHDDILDYIFQEYANEIYFFNAFKKYIFEFEKKLMKNNQTTILVLLSLANIFWSLSFHEQYRKYFSLNAYLIKKLDDFYQNELVDDSLLNVYIPSDMCLFKRTIDGISYNLNPSKLDVKSTRKSSMTCSIMISYSHLNMNFCRDLIEILSKISEFSIHVDFMTGKYFWEETRQTIEQADLVLFLLSDEFYTSKSCRQEFLHVTDRITKLFFPIFINEFYKPIGWIQKRIARLKTIRFTHENFLDNCEQLLNLINENLSMNISLKTKISSEIVQWTRIEIQNWFTKENLRQELYEFYNFQNGQQLLLYAQATLAYPWTKEYERIKGRFQEDNLSSNDFQKFIVALKHLPK